jgi:hypothetical protein
MGGDEAAGLAQEYGAEAVRSASPPEPPTIAMSAMPILPGLSPLAGKPLTATFDAGRLPSDGDVIVLREIAMRLGLAETMAGPLDDERDPSASSTATPRCAGADGYDRGRVRGLRLRGWLRSDPALKINIGRAPESGADLMSQPTLSRLENLADWRALARIGLRHDFYCKSFARRPPHRARHRRHRRSHARPAGVGALQRPLRLHLLPADPHLRRPVGQTPAEPPTKIIEVGEVAGCAAVLERIADAVVKASPQLPTPGPEASARSGKDWSKARESVATDDRRQASDGGPTRSDCRIPTSCSR